MSRGVNAYMLGNMLLLQQLGLDNDWTADDSRFFPPKEA